MGKGGARHPPLGHCYTWRLRRNKVAKYAELKDFLINLQFSKYFVHLLSLTQAGPGLLFLLVLDAGAGLLGQRNKEQWQG